jgi:hypothetical protein
MRSWVPINFKFTMKRFFTFLFLFFSFAVLGQNLIPDGSAEVVVECPSSLGNIDIYTSSWQSFRGSPDYWHSCSTNEGLGWDNSLGFQEPKTGEGYLGLITFSRNLNNAREYLGTELIEPLMIGEEYFLTFYVSKGHVDNNYNGASNNIGALFMTENFLFTDEQDPTPNFSTFNDIEIVEDTINWVEMSYQFIADSAYQFLAFGNFFDDSLTDTVRVGGETDGELRSYYYFDDFCLTTSLDGCDFTNSTNNQNAGDVSVYPNPCTNRLFIEQETQIELLEIYTPTGELLVSRNLRGINQAKLSIDLPSGSYFLTVYSKEQKVTKRFVVSK